MGRIKPIKAASLKGGGGRIKASAPKKATKATAKGKRAAGVAKAAMSVAGTFVPAPVRVAATVGRAVVGKVQAVRAARAGKAAPARFGRRRRGIVPKTVKKWVGKMVRRRKQETKVLNKLMSASGAKRMFGGFGSRRGSKGVITKGEALAALRK